jgi:AcrR family transcriptional regulator
MVAKAGASSVSPVPGLRERSKRERRRRIEQAAREIFEEKGFERATTREIAARADVSPATLFLYATEKRELLLTLYRDDLWALNESAFAELPDAPLLEQLEHILARRYSFWVGHPGLSRHVIRELAREASNDRPPVPEAGIRSAFFSLRERIAGLIAAHQAAGTFASEIDPADAARLIMHVYLAEHRTWIDAPQPDVASGVRTLLHFLELLLRGYLVRKDLT